jgi:protein TonB
MEKRHKLQILAFALVATCCIPFQGLMAQNGIGYPEKDVVQVAEIMPVLETCASIDDRTERETCSNTGIMEHIIANLDYPELAREKNIEGTVYVECVVNQKGYVSSVEIVRGPSLLQKAALTVVQSLPGFKPGTNQGKPVNVHYVLPIRFALGE